MNSFTLCHNLECKRRSTCKRGLGDDDPYQSNAYYPGGAKCFGYIPLRTERRKERTR